MSSASKSIDSITIAYNVVDLLMGVLLLFLIGLLKAAPTRAGVWVENNMAHEAVILTREIDALYQEMEALKSGQTKEAVDASRHAFLLKRRDISMRAKKFEELSEEDNLNLQEQLAAIRVVHAKQGLDLKLQEELASSAQKRDLAMRKNQRLAKEELIPAINDLFRKNEFELEIHTIRSMHDREKRRKEIEAKLQDRQEQRAKLMDPEYDSRPATGATNADSTSQQAFVSVAIADGV